MTDRELLELAAKAAGIWVKSAVEDYQDSFIALRVKPSKDAGRETTVDWNPLTDDGDALRLAVKLLLDILQCPDGKVEVTNQFTRDEDVRWAWESHGNDSTAATRRAIVRAAAEIGKAMP